MRLYQILLLCTLLFIFPNCKDREITNPFDLACPKELFTPSDFKADQQGTAMKLTWMQANSNISGFVISRNENDGTREEVAKVDKSITLWSDNNIVGGKKYSYQLLANAGDNLSNPLHVVIAPVLGTTVLTTSAKTVNVTHQSLIPVVGLVAYYPFNGNANDESGYGNNCIVHNAELIPDRKGKQNRAYSFNGSDAYIIANNNNVGNISGNTTFCLWINVATNGVGWIMDKDFNDYYFFNADANGLNFQISFNLNYASKEQIITKSQMENQWNFIAVVIENYSYKIYANGKYIKTSNIPQNAVINTQNLSIGRQGHLFSNYFSGKIDDIRIYNLALTDNEIQQLYNE